MECLLDCPRIKQSMGTNFVKGCLSLLEKRRHLRGRDKRWSEIDRSVSQSCWHKVWNCFHKVTITPALWWLNVSFSLWQCERDHWWVSILFRANPTNLFSFVVCSFQITEHLLEELVFISFWLRTINQDVTSATLTTSKSTFGCRFVDFCKWRSGWRFCDCEAYFFITGNVSSLTEFFSA